MKILLAVDGSKSSDAALRAVIKERRPTGDEVRVITVLQPLLATPVPQMAAGYAPELEAERKRARELVEKSAETLRAAGFRALTACARTPPRRPYSRAGNTRVLLNTSRSPARNSSGKSRNARSCISPVADAKCNSRAPARSASGSCAINSPGKS